MPEPNDIIVGRNPVREAIKAGRSVNKLLIAQGCQGKIQREFIDLAKERGILWQKIERQRLDTLTDGMNHQGVVAFVSPVAYVETEEILATARQKNEPPFLILLDEINDPHNFGAILRTAEAAGVHGILIPKRRNVPLNATVAKTSAGAVEYVKVARIGNVNQTLINLKKEGLWVVGADMTGEQNYWEADLKVPLVLVIGSEGAGLGRLTKETCDFLVKIPMRGELNSLNAATAAAVLIYEATRQRIKSP